MLTINDFTLISEELESDTFSYQPVLTSKLDQLDTDFDQEVINEIVLWKVNRYAVIDSETLDLINQIKKHDTKINPELTGGILLRLLCKQQKGFRLAMASTILRFKNPKIYQIIDQRVFRFIYGRELEYSATNINEQINLYLDYLQRLRKVCAEHAVDFESADRVFYTMDKIYNPDMNLKGY